MPDLGRGLPVAGVQLLVAVHRHFAGRAGTAATHARARSAVGPRSGVAAAGGLARPALAEASTGDQAADLLALAALVTYGTFLATLLRGRA